MPTGMNTAPGGGTTRERPAIITTRRPKEIEKKHGLKKGEFHREVKPDILSDLTNKNSPYKDLMKKMGNNPDIYLSSNGQIEIVSTQFKGKSFVTDLNIADFLP